MKQKTAEAAYLETLVTNCQIQGHVRSIGSNKFMKKAERKHGES